MKLGDFIVKEAVVTHVQAHDRNGVIKELVTALAASGAIGSVDPAEVTRAVIARENEGSTGFGKGVAVPHAKTGMVQRVIGVVGRCPDGIDFSALDRAPVYTVILLLAPQSQPELHLEAMECIFRNLSRDNFRRFLRQAASGAEIAALLQEADDTPA